MSDRWILTAVRPWGGPATDILIEADRIGEIGSGSTDGIERVDGRGAVALPGFVNAHAHVDKSWWGRPWVSNAGAESVAECIALERRDRAEHGIPSVEGTVLVLRELLRHGTTAVRSHVDVDLGVGLTGIEQVREAAASLGGAVDVEIVAFPQDGVIRRPGVL